MTGWAVELNGVVFEGGDGVDTEGEALACLTSPPDGLGVPGLRVEDQVFPQRDGAAQYTDWYEPRILTMENVQVTSDNCEGCPNARAKAKMIAEAWSRHCGETELVVFPDCEPGETAEEREITGPFGVVGRPRVAELTWRAGTSRAGIGTFRFDSVDHRLYVLDADGTPGSGGVCEPVEVSQLADYSDLVTEGDPLAYWLLGERTGLVAKAEIGEDGIYQPGVERRGPLTPYLGNGSVFRPATQISKDGLPVRGQSTSPLSLEFWGKFESGGPALLVSELEDPPSVDTGGMLFFNTGGIFYYDPNSSPNLTEYSFSPTTTDLLLSEGGHHVVWQPGELWVDGILRESDPDLKGPGETFTENQLFVRPYNSVVSNVAVYGDSLSSSDIALHYEAGSTGAVGEIIPTELNVGGNLCVPVEITFTGQLTNPRVRQENGNYVGLDRVVGEGQSITIDTATGRATGSDGTDYTRFVIGDPFLQVAPGEQEFTAVSEDLDDNGTVQICYRPAVISG